MSRVNQSRERRAKTYTQREVSPSRGTVGREQFAYVKSLERGLTVIKSFGEHSPEQSVSDVAHATGLNRAAARRFLLTLQQLGYVEQDGRKFRLRPQTLQLGYAYLSSLPWWRSAQRAAERVRDRVRLNCAVGVLDGDDVVYVAYASVARFTLLNRSVGAHLPAFATAIGRVLLAGLSDEELNQRLDRMRLDKLTPVTVTDRTDIARILAETRTNGYSYVDQELEVGLRSLGVPIFNRGGDIVAAMSVSLIEGQLNRSVIVTRYLEPLQIASREITETLPN